MSVPGAWDPKGLGTQARVPFHTDQRQQPFTGDAGMMRGFLRLAEFVQALFASCALLF
jgi:hypothetical protein